MPNEFRNLRCLLSGVTYPMPVGLDRLGLTEKPSGLRLRGSDDCIELRPGSGVASLPQVTMGRICASHPGNAKGPGFIGEALSARWRL